jgi:hypothetical protein
MPTDRRQHDELHERYVSGHGGRSTSQNVELVERFPAAFDRRRPTDEDLDALLTPDGCFVERPNLVNPKGGERDAATMRAGIAAGRQLLAWQSYFSKSPPPARSANG